jgi:TonB family protein
MHALLFVIICVAPAFLPEKPRVSTPVINMIDPRVLDALDPKPAASAPPASVPVLPALAAPPVVEPAPVPKPVEPPRPVEPTPPPPAPAPKPVEPVKKKEVAKEPPPKPVKVEPRPLPVSSKGKEAPVKKQTKKTKEPEPEPPAKPAKTTPTKSTIKIANTTTLVSRKAEEDARAKERAEAEERAQSIAAAKAAQQAHLQRVAKMKTILGGIQGGLSSPVDINIDAGGGPNAAAFLDYGQMMVRTYEQMWLVPLNLTESLAVVGVTVTVARNGRVIEWAVRKPSGNSAIDKSVRETLQKVIQFEPFPASFREPQRTFNIDFNLKAKRTTG